jgi:hypothetical protein
MRRGAHPDALVCFFLEQTAEDAIPKMTRAHLRQAGVSRPALFETSSVAVMANFWSWRDSWCTWLALSGVPIDRIESRAGHDAIETTLGYCKLAEDLTHSVGTPFPALPPSLLEDELSSKLDKRLVKKKTGF